MKTSQAGVATLRQREGCVLRWYKDTRGIDTCCVGHTAAVGPPYYKEGQTFTQAEADAILARDLQPFEAAVNGAIKRPMSQGQFDACVSLAFNIGAHGFAGSSVVRRFNAGDIEGAADAFLMWDKPPELMGRRQKERAQFLAAPAEPGPIIATHVGTGGSTVSTPSKAKAGAVVVAGGAAAGAAAAPHGGWIMAALIVLALIAAAVAIAIHWRK